MYGGPIKLMESHYESGIIKQVYDNRDVYLIYPDDSSPTGRIVKQEPLTEEQFKELLESLEEEILHFRKKYSEK